LPPPKLERLTTMPAKPASPRERSASRLARGDLRAVAQHEPRRVRRRVDGEAERRARLDRELLGHEHVRGDGAGRRVERELFVLEHRHADAGEDAEDRHREQHVDQSEAAGPGSHARPIGPRRPRAAGATPVAAPDPPMMVAWGSDLVAALARAAPRC
jgi:hypothetical protein